MSLRSFLHFSSCRKTFHFHAPSTIRHRNSITICSDTYPPTRITMVNAAKLGPGYVHWVKKYSSRPGHVPLSPATIAELDNGEAPAHGEGSDSQVDNAWGDATATAEPSKVDSPTDRDHGASQTNEVWVVAGENEQTGKSVSCCPRNYTHTFAAAVESPAQSAWDPDAPQKPAPPLELEGDHTASHEALSKIHSPDDSFAEHSITNVSRAASLDSTSRTPTVAEPSGKHQKPADYVATYWEMGKALRQKCVEINADLNNGRRMPSPEIHAQLDSLFQEAQLRARKTEEALQELGTRSRDLVGKTAYLSDKIDHVDGRTEYLSGVSAHTDKTLDDLTNLVKQLASNVTKHDQIVQAILGSQATLQQEMDVVKQDFTVLDRLCDDLAVDSQEWHSSRDQQAQRALGLAQQPAMQLRPVSEVQPSKALENELKAIRTAVSSCEQRMEHLSRSSVTMSTRIASVEHNKGGRLPSSASPAMRFETANTDTNNDVLAKKSQIVKEISDKITEGVKLIADLEAAANASRQESDLMNVKPVQGRDHDGTMYFPGGPFMGQTFTPGSVQGHTMNATLPFWPSSHNISNHR